LQQQDSQPQASEPIVHQPVTPCFPYDPDILYPDPPKTADPATALVIRTQREAYLDLRDQLLDVAARYNALLQATGGPIITVNALPASEPTFPCKEAAPR
jgi:hypothetical protein